MTRKARPASEVLEGVVDVVPCAMMMMRKKQERQGEEAKAWAGAHVYATYALARRGRNRKETRVRRSGESRPYLGGEQWQA